MSGTSWVTLATNDSYSLGALVLGHSLRRVGTVHHLTVLITPGVTQPMRDKLSKIFNTVKEVNVLDSKDEANLALLARPELGITFTKLNCWRLAQFSKGVFLDADTLVLQNCDELFDREELSAAPDAGWPDCFNSGVFVFRPSEATYQALIQFALTNGSFDGGDQGLLNLFFSDWATKDISRHLPFIYNMVSTATYSYLPAFKQYGSNVKIAHFIGAAKPWLQYFDTETQKVTPPPSSTHLQGLLQIWWDIFCSQVHPDLSQDMAGLAGALAQLTLGVPRSAEQTALEEHLRRQSWEQGNADYMGRDSFDNIWKKISETLAQVPEPKVEEHKPQDIEARVPESPQVTEVPLSQVTQPEFISELKLECAEPKVESIPTSNLESTPPVTSAPPIDKEPVLSPSVIDTTLVLQPEQKLSVNNVETTSESSANIVTETIPTFISEYPPVDQTTVSDSSAAAAVLPELQDVTQKVTIPTNKEEVKESSTPVTETKVSDKITPIESSQPEDVPTQLVKESVPLVTETKVPDTSTPIETSQAQDVPIQLVKESVPLVTETKAPDTSTPIETIQAQDIPTQQVKESVPVVTETKVPDTSTPIESSQTQDIPTRQEKDNEVAKPVVTPEIPEPVPCLPQESLVKSDQQPPLPVELEKATIVMDVPAVETAPSQPQVPNADNQVVDTPVPSPACPPEPSLKLDSAGPKLDIKEPVTSTEQIILSNTTELPSSATEPPLLVNVITDIKIPSQADSCQILPPDLSGSQLPPTTPAAEVTPTILESASIQTPVELPPTTPAADVTPTILESASIQTPVDQPPFVKLSDITESQQSQIPTDKVVPADPVIEKPVSSPITTVPIESTGQQEVSSSSDTTIKSTQPDSVPQTPESPVTKPVSTALVAVPKKRPAKLPEAPKPTIPLPAPDSASTPPISQQTPDLPPTSDSQILATGVVTPESIPSCPILPSAEVQPTPTQAKPSSTEGKTEIVSEARETVQEKQVSKEEGKPQTTTEATKVVLEKQLSKEEKANSEIDSKKQPTKPSKVIKQSSKETESTTKTEGSQPETAPVKPKPKGLKGPKGPKSPPIKDAPQTPPPTKDAPQTPPPTKDAPKPPSPTKDVPKPPSPTKDAPKPPSPTKDAPKPPSPTKDAPKPPSPTKDAPKPPSPTKDAPKPPSPTKDAPQTPTTKDAPQTPTVTAATPPTSPVSTPLTSPTSESLKVDQTQPGTPPVTSATPDVSGSSTQTGAAEAISPPVPPKRKNAKSTTAQSTDGAKPAQPKVSKPVKPKK